MSHMYYRLTNSQLRQLCELEEYLRVSFQPSCSQSALVLSPSATSHFSKRLMKHQDKVEVMKDELFTIFYKYLPKKARLTL